ncbi:ribonuclease G [Arenicella sp.]|nr:ribonuclease G [Arenicella sp.]
MNTRRELLLNVTPRETRVALTEDGVLQELHLERTLSRGLVGNIFKAKVVRVLPGMQAAFVDLGLDKNGFLHAGDVRVADPAFAQKSLHDTLPINELVREGQTVIVQVLKEPVGDKGARVTTELSIPSRNLVYMPLGCEIGISQKIVDKDERQRLRALLANQIDEHQVTGRMIVRTLAESARDQEINSDILFLQRLWQHITNMIKNSDSVALVHEDIPLTLRTLRDLVDDDIERVLIDCNEVFLKAQEFARQFMPEISAKVTLDKGEQTLFSSYSVEQQIKQALERKVNLKSGGHLIIDHTEAMTTIDVNTGSYVGRRNHQDTFFNTNLEAASEIAHQLRLRNTGGIIIVDFIDMQTQHHKQKILDELDSAIEKDRVKIQIIDMTPLGLVEITRKRAWESLEQLMCEPCTVCDGRGMVKTSQTVCYEILREVLREDRQYKARAYTVIASPAVIDLLLDEEAKSLADLEELIQRSISLQVDQLYQQQQYEIVLN